MIERHIHQIWIQGESHLPEKLKDNMNKIMNMHIHSSKSNSNEWKYTLWDEIEIIRLMKTNMEWLKKYYQFQYLHQKVDFAKFVILLTYGGVYIDMDAVTEKPLDKLFNEYYDYDFIVSEIKPLGPLAMYITCGSTDYCINNGVYIAKKGADILSYLIKNTQTECSPLSTKISCITNTTGPSRFTTLIKMYIEEKGPSKIKILSYETLEPCVYDDCDITDHTYIVHRHENTWVSDWSQFIAKMYTKNSVACTVCIVLITLIVLFLIISNISNISSKK